MKRAAQVIRDTVTMDQILDLYGYKAKHGFMCCPFHGEKEPSLRIYKKTGGWHCFGCGKGGSVIDFVMEQEGCTFRDAVWAIDGALGLGLYDPHENAFDARQEKRLQECMDAFRDAADAWLDAQIRVIECRQLINYHKLKEIEDLKAERPEEMTAADYMFLLTWKEEDQYDSYLIDKIQEQKEAVAAWRRKARRAK